MEARWASLMVQSNSPPRIGPEYPFLAEGGSIQRHGLISGIGVEDDICVRAASTALTLPPSKPVDHRKAQGVVAVHRRDHRGGFFQGYFTGYQLARAEAKGRVVIVERSGTP